MFSLSGYTTCLTYTVSVHNVSTEYAPSSRSPTKQSRYSLATQQVVSLHILTNNPTKQSRYSLAIQQVVSLRVPLNSLAIVSLYSKQSRYIFSLTVSIYSLGTQYIVSLHYLITVSVHIPRTVSLHSSTSNRSQDDLNQWKMRP